MESTGAYWKPVFNILEGCKRGKNRIGNVMEDANVKPGSVLSDIFGGTPFEEKRGNPMTEEQKQRLIRHHVRRLGKLGIPVRVPPAATVRLSCGRQRNSVKR